ncbi:alpha/beta fold hydrolase [Arthrobacter sp. VKM Ac-2550]|uniref:alpha/beta fold hydrolase n=1 Tax=Crystallibacter permensis TaxID=1938888 RepID=UPI002225D205|nr:alpha/beta hydrolase [Arthrobacter sp. VKM Ac-2550]MCW2131927.1 Pimeloyl-ACP methyl ester carboxylesterase [Arthrobacter sp. VKM Ac-2550]
MSRVSRQLPNTTSHATQGAPKKRRRPFRRTLKTTGVIALTALGITLASTTANALLEQQEKSSTAQYGGLVEVTGGEVNVVRAGTEGAQPLVLLSGLGTVAPALDFAPLIRELDAYDVVVVEGFGYGYSDMSAPERTVKNISTEIHEALSSLDLEKPYVLAGHSIAGFYTLDYANRYPSEVSAVVGIDPSVPAAMADTDSSPGGGINVVRILSTIGLVRTVVSIAPNLVDPPSDDYTRAELERACQMTVWNYGNAAVADESARVGSNAAALHGVTYPNDLPVLNLLASDSIATIPNWLEAHENQLKNVSHHEIVEVEGPHNLQWTQSKAMAKKITEFLQGSATSQVPPTPLAAATEVIPGN